LPELRRYVSEQQILLWSLGIDLVVGLAADVGGYLLRSSATTEPLGLVADLLYALGWALWTGVVVVLFVQIFPQAKRRQIKRRWMPMRRRCATRRRGTTERPQRGSGQAEQPSEQGKQKDQPKLGNTL
jgi:hypothetical protein